MFSFSGIEKKNSSGIKEENSETFSSPPFHLIAVHGSTGGGGEYPKLPNQNLIEMVYVQHVCNKLSESDQLVILAGDFNTQEENNKNDRLWDDRPRAAPGIAEEATTKSESENDEKAKGTIIDVTAVCNSREELSVPLERECLGAIRNKFLDNFERAVPPGLPTNVYPFLAGQTGQPKHNDDIFIQRKGVKKIEGGVSCIPLDVLRRWDKITQQYFDAKPQLCKLGRRNAQILNSALSRVWSDHRPIYARFTRERRQSTGKNRTTPKKQNKAQST